MTQTDIPPPPAAQPKGTAVLSLILGIMGFVLSFALIGALIAIPGLFMGILHLRHYAHDRVLALWGTFVSGVAVALAILFGVLYAQLMYFGPLSLSDAFDESWESSFSKWEGVTAPNISMTTLDGEVIDLNNLKGRRVLLHVWDPESHESLELVPVLNELHGSQPREDLVVIALSEPDAGDLGAVVESYKLRYPVATARVVPPPYDEVFYPPVTFIIDRNGVMQHVIEDHEDLDALKSYATGPDFKGNPTAAPEAPQSMVADPPSPAALELAWSVPASQGCLTPHPVPTRGLPRSGR